jgi:mannose-6-phosphate isomerase-like protein (cupin superfamily)
MDVFEINEISAERAATDKLYLEFIKSSSLSVGLYELKAGENDPQQPHTEDEVYYVIDGQGEIFVDGEDREVNAGSIVYVAAGAEHRFHSITKNLSLLVFFAPAEYSNSETSLE